MQHWVRGKKNKAYVSLLIRTQCGIANGQVTREADIPCRKSELLTFSPIPVS